ncbi:hypothetical protein RvY_01053 [Ramazzottius varieornatus]|uniref:VHS domain-containing protein n=1 Tax=Ramazzottius varieornatus TaxID=947166 RepID=A0A1D1UEX6_RAMVA|nr:hypothetical protein RvY_01053 [Ramazzottius varieornatus]
MLLTDVEDLLFRLTDPRTSSREQDVETDFIKAIQSDNAVLAHSLRTLAHRVQSPCEREAINALATLDNIAKRGGRGVQSELGKFRFLNELIKVVSPKYLGDKTTDAVKQKVISLLFHWSQMMRYEQKVVEAYNMLKQQGIVKDDPASAEPPPPPPAARPKNPIIEDEERARLLRKLLQSREPADMVAANRLIKSMVREDDQRMEKIIRRHSDLIHIKENAKLLSDMLKQYSPASSSLQEREIMRQLFDSCELHRPKVFKLAAEMAENTNTETEDGPSLADILSTSDELTEVIERYRSLGLAAEKFDGRKPHEGAPAALVSFDDKTPGPSTSRPSAPPLNNSPAVQPTSSSKDDVLSLLEDVFSDPDTHSAPTLFHPTPVHPVPVLNGSKMLTAAPMQPVTFPPAMSNISRANDSQNGSAQTPAAMESLSSKPRGLVDFDDITNNFLGMNLGDAQLKSRSFHAALDTRPKATLSELQRVLPATSDLSPKGHPNNAARSSFSRDEELLDSNPFLASSSSSRTDCVKMAPGGLNSASINRGSIGDISVSLQDIQPEPVEPIQIYNQNQLNIVLYRTKNRPREDCVVFVASAKSSNSTLVKDFTLSFFASKGTQVKIQPTTSSDIPPYNPIFPAGPVSHVLIVASEAKHPLSLQYQVDYTLNNRAYSDSGTTPPLPV